MPQRSMFWVLRRLSNTLSSAWSALLALLALLPGLPMSSNRTNWHRRPRQHLAPVQRALRALYTTKYLMEQVCWRPNWAKPKTLFSIMLYCISGGPHFRIVPVWYLPICSPSRGHTKNIADVEQRRISVQPGGNENHVLSSFVHFSLADSVSMSIPLTSRHTAQRLLLIPRFSILWFLTVSAF